MRNLCAKIGFVRVFITFLSLNMCRYLNIQLSEDNFKDIIYAFWYMINRLSSMS